MVPIIGYFDALPILLKLKDRWMTLMLDALRAIPEEDFSILV